MARTAGHILVDALVTLGVDHFFTVPGESFLPLLDALHQHPTAKLFTHRHEEGAAFAAEGFGKAAHRPAVVMATRAVGAMNLGIAVHTARQDSTPLIVLLGQVPTGFRDREAFQELPLDEIFGRIAKWSAHVPSAERVVEYARRAWTQATTGRPGPVVLVLPEDVLWQPATETIVKPVRVIEPSLDPQAVVQFSSWMAGAEFPLLVVGGGVLAAGAVGAAVELAERHGLGVMTAFRRFDAFPNDHPAYLGPLMLAAPNELTQPLSQADPVISVGTRWSEVTGQGYRLPGNSARVLVIDRAPEMGGLPDREVCLAPGSARLALEHLLEAAPPSPPLLSRRKATVAFWHDAYLRFSTPPCPVVTDGVDLSHMLEVLGRRLPPDAALVTDAGNFSGWVARFYRFRTSGTHFGPTSGAMGYGLPAALGVKLANPDRTVLSVSGDGGFMMTVSELETAQRHGIGVIAVVCVNDLYGTIHGHQQRRFPGRSTAVALHNPSFAAWAQALGIRAYRVEHIADFEAAIEQALNHGGPSVIEVMMDRTRFAVGSYPT